MAFRPSYEGWKLNRPPPVSADGLVLLDLPMRDGNT